MLAAILICGLTTTVLTACGDDDDDPTSNTNNNNNNSVGGGSSQPSSYDVTFTVVAPVNGFNIAEYDFIYANDQGTKITKEIDSDMANESLSEQEKVELETFIKLSSGTMPSLSEHLSPSNIRVQHFTLKNQPAGCNISYELVMHLNTDYAIAEGEAAVFTTPAVEVAFIPNNGVRTLFGNFGCRSFNVSYSKWDDFVTKKDGEKVLQWASVLGYENE